MRYTGYVVMALPRSSQLPRPTSCVVLKRPSRCNATEAQAHKNGKEKVYYTG